MYKGYLKFMTLHNNFNNLNSAISREQNRFSTAPKGYEKQNNIIPAIIGAAASLVGSGIGSAMSGSEARKARHAQEAQFRETMDWNKEVQQKTWEREDTAYQRAAADAQAAGFSPLIVGDGSTSGATVAGPSGTVSGGDSGAGSILSQGMQQLGGLLMQNKALDQQQSQFDVNNQTEKDKMAQQDSQFQQKLKADADALQAQLDQSDDQFTRNLLERKLEFSRTYTLSMQELELAKKNSNHKISMDLVKAENDAIKQMSEAYGFKISFKYYDDPKELYRARQIWYHQFYDKTQSLGPDIESETRSLNEGASSSSGYSYGLGFSAAGSGVSGNFGDTSSASSNFGQSNSITRNWSTKQRAEMNSWGSIHPYPMASGSLVAN